MDTLTQVSVMMSSGQPVIRSGILGTVKRSALAMLIALTSVSVSHACNGGGGGDGGGGHDGGGGGGRDRDEHGGWGSDPEQGGGGSGGGGGATISTTAPAGFDPSQMAALITALMGGGSTFMGLRVPIDFPSGDCTTRVSQEIRNIPEMQESFVRVQSEADRAQELENIANWLRSSPAGQEFANNVQRAVPGEGTGRGLDDFRRILSAADLNRLAPELQVRNDLAYERNGIVSALRSELANATPNASHVQSLQDRLNNANAALAIQQSRIAQSFAGARTGAQAATAAQQQANVFVGGLTVSVLTNVVSGGAGSAVGGGVRGIMTDVVVGGALNYGQAQFQSGTSDPNAGTKAVVTNTTSSLLVTAAEEIVEQKLGPAKEVIKVTRDALAAAGVQAALDEALARGLAHDSNKK
jgi:hypothetical protein